MTGQLTYTIPGSYSFVCPPDVTSVSVVCIGGGGQSGSSEGTDSVGGGGGGLGYKNNITVVPGNSYLVVVGEGGKYDDAHLSGMSGGDSYFISNTTVSGLGGKGGTTYGNAGAGGGYVGDGGGNGGAGGAANSLQGGGGGAGGYSGNGGDGLSSASGSSGAGSGGAGGGGYKAGGGGVGVLGIGTTGAASSSGTIGKGGSGGADSIIRSETISYINNAGVATETSFMLARGIGGAYGGGGGSCVLYGNGADGAVRIIWPGDSRAFPSTNTGDAGIGTITVNRFDIESLPPVENQSTDSMFIRIRDGEPFHHPMIEYNFKLCFPEVVGENGYIDDFDLDCSKYQKFENEHRPPLDIYCKDQTFEYKNCNEYVGLNIDQSVTPNECPENSIIKGVSSKAIGFAQTGANGIEIRISNTTGTFWNVEQIQITTSDDTIITRNTTSVGIGTTSFNGEMRRRWRKEDDSIGYLTPSSYYKKVWTYSGMTDEEKIAKQNSIKSTWSVGLGTVLTSWTFDESLCKYVPPLSVPLPAPVGIVTNIALYNTDGSSVINADGTAGVGTEPLRLFDRNNYRWDESVYQGDNTKGWVTD